MRTYVLFFLVFLVNLFWAGTVAAAAAVSETSRQGVTSTLTLERIFSSDEFRTEPFGPARWLRHHTGYTTLELSDSDAGGKDIVRYNPDNGKREILVSACRLVPPGETIPLDIADYQWSADGRRLLIFTDTKQVWRQNTRGDYWLLDPGGSLWKLGGEAEPSTLMFAKFSPGGSRVAYVRENNLYVQELGNRKITQLTSDGSSTVINGTFDWVYEEEFNLQDGFRWSPDGKTIAYWQLDTEGVGTFYLINNTGGLYSTVIPVQYPKAGTTNSAARVGVVSSGGGKTLWFGLPGDPRRHYIARMDWAGNSDEVVIQYLNRLQNTNRLILGNARTGELRTILSETDEAWLDVVDDLHWLNNGKQFTWVSERDGWRHAYLISRSGKDVRLITPGDFDIIGIEKVDTKGGRLYYIASPDNAGQRYLYRTRLNGEGKPRRLTPMNQPGTHSYRLSGDARWAIHTYSSFGTPPVIDLVRLPEHRSVRTLVDNAGIRKRLAALNPHPVEFFSVETEDGVRLDGWCMKPPDFDQKRKYPVLFYVYGEPWEQTVLDLWSRRSYLWHLLLTQRGYIVMSVDNRGTPAPRGREWRKCVYGGIGILASADQAAAVRAVIKERPYVDAQRIGIWGWSGGGAMTLNALFRYPDLYRTGMSVAPVTDQRYYDTIYQERYMGLPDQNKEGYKNGSPITFAHQLKGNLLLVHGTGDDNVHFQNTEALINALVEADKQFSLMVYPNRMHGISEGRNTTRHLFELLTGYLKNNLPTGN